MTTEIISNREKALHIASSDTGTAEDVVRRAGIYLAFLEDKAVATPKATRAGKTATPAPAVASAAEAPAPVASPVNTQAVAGPAQPVEQTKVAATPAKAPTLDDVRLALTTLSTKTGSKVAAQAVLDKYSPTKVTGGLKVEDYAKVIAECAAA